MIYMNFKYRVDRHQFILEFALISFIFFFLAFLVLYLLFIITVYLTEAVQLLPISLKIKTLFINIKLLQISVKIRPEIFLNEKVFLESSSVYKDALNEGSYSHKLKFWKIITINTARSQKVKSILAFMAETMVTMASDDFRPPSFLALLLP